HAACQLHLTVANGRLTTAGQGSGEVRQVRIAGQPTAGPIRLALQQKQDATSLCFDLQIPPCDLSALASKLDAQLPAETNGQLALTVSATLPLDTINDPRTFQADGKVTLRDAQLAGLALDPVEAALHYADGELQVDEFQAKF